MWEAFYCTANTEPPMLLQENSSLRMPGTNTARSTICSESRSRRPGSAVGRIDPLSERKPESNRSTNNETRRLYSGGACGGRGGAATRSTAISRPAVPAESAAIEEDTAARGFGVNETSGVLETDSWIMTAASGD